MNLLKAIIKTTISLLKWLAITILILGTFILIIGALQTPTGKNIGQISFFIIMGLIFLFMIIACLVESIQENYERITRKSKSPISAYKINYNIVYKRSAVVSGKTKREALENLYCSVHEGEDDLDCHYKTIKISEIK